MLSREADLLADLPSLKALMATGDVRTIRDGSDEFADLSGSDFFVLASPAGILYTYTNRDVRLESKSTDAGVRDCLETLPTAAFSFLVGDFIQSRPAPSTSG